jgi:two-component system phosphate regulon sensor histidine kinase PhoR
LSIVKHIIEAHKQTITLESEYGEGSEFTFTLKRA